MNFPKFLRLIILPRTEHNQINSTTTIKRMYFHPAEIEVAVLLAKMYKFSYELVSPGDAEYGKQLPNGNWTGMVDMLLRCEGDIIVSILTITLERMEFLKFSFPLLITPNTFVTTKPEYSPDVSAFLSPFTRDMWISLLALLIIMPVIFWTFLKRRYTYGKLLLATFRSLLLQSFIVRPQNVKEYLLIFFYIIGTIFFIHSYTCNLLSFIMIPKVNGVRNIRELAEAVSAGKYKCVSYPGTYIAALLSKSVDSNFRMIGRDLQQNEASFDIFDVLRGSKKNSKRAFIATKDRLKPFKQKYFVSEDEFLPNILALGMRKNFCCREQVTRFVIYINSYGLYQRIFDLTEFRDSLKYVFQKDEGDADHSVRQFSLEDLAGAFIVLCIGHALSFAMFTFEMIFQRFSKNFKSFPYASQIHPEITECEI